MVNKLQTDLKYTTNPIEFSISDQNAHYILVGRIGENGIEYSWLIPKFTKDDTAKINPVMPLKTNWVLLDNRLDNNSDTIENLREYAIQLSINKAWLQLNSPNNGCAFPYRLGLKNTETSEIIFNRNGDTFNNNIADKELMKTVEGEKYKLILLAREKDLTEWKEQINCSRSRFIYVFALDSNANRVLLFPLGGSNVEHRIPYDTQTDSDYPKEIHLGNLLIEIIEPFGIDTYFLITTENAIPNPLALNSESVRNDILRGKTFPLKLIPSNSRAKGQIVKVPTNWSIERLVLRSVPKQ